jgi:hypothetical protein
VLDTVKITGQQISLKSIIVWFAARLSAQCITITNGRNAFLQSPDGTETRFVVIRQAKSVPPQPVYGTASGLELSRPVLTTKSYTRTKIQYSCFCTHPAMLQSFKASPSGALCFKNTRKLPKTLKTTRHSFKVVHWKMLGCVRKTFSPCVRGAC